MTHIGSIVYYKLSMDDAGKINRRREHGEEHMFEHVRQASGVQVHVGNSASGGTVVPLIVTNVWPDDKINGQAILDGNDSYWVTSAEEGVDEGQWDRELYI